MTRDCFLALQELATDLIHEKVDRGVHVFMPVTGRNLVTLNLDDDRGFHPKIFLRHLLCSEVDEDIDHLVKTTNHAVELLDHILAECGGQFDLTADDCQIHYWSPILAPL